MAAPFEQWIRTALQVGRKPSNQAEVPRMSSDRSMSYLTAVCLSFEWSKASPFSPGHCCSA